MNGAEILTCTMLAGGVIALAVQYGIAIGEKRRADRTERERGAEIKVLLEHVGNAWRRS